MVGKKWEELDELRRAGYMEPLDLVAEVCREVGNGFGARRGWLDDFVLSMAGRNEIDWLMPHDSVTNAGVARGDSLAQR